MQKIALVITSILSVVFLSTTIIEHNKLNALSQQCTASTINGIKAIKGLIDSTNPNDPKNGTRF
jgi:hypothetical protein